MAPPLYYIFAFAIHSLTFGGYFKDVLIRYNKYLWGFKGILRRPRDARYPVLPYWLDGTELNGWDQQSQYFGWRLVGWLIIFDHLPSVLACFASSILHITQNLQDLLRNGYFTRSMAAERKVLEHF